MLFGLGLGLIVAAAVYFSGLRSDALRSPAAAAPEAPTGATPARRGGAAERGTLRPAADSTRTQSDRAATEAAAKAGSTEPAVAGDRPEPRFDFYDILPQFEVVIPEVETVTETPAAAPAPVAAPGRYILQTGSFRSHADADRMQASLALLGIESRIQKVTIDDDVFHRVRVGPISDLDALNRTRAQLRNAGIDALMMQVND